MSELGEDVDDPGEVREDMLAPEVANWLRSKGIPDSFRATLECKCQVNQSRLLQTPLEIIIIL